MAKTRDKARKKYKVKVGFLVFGLVFCIALAGFLVFWFFGARYPAFAEKTKEEAPIPGLKEGLCPQGVCALPEGGEYRFAVSGYMKDDSPSRIYFVGEGARYITLEENGSVVKAHFGGITYAEGYLFVTGDRDILRVSLAEALAAENGGSVAVTDKFTTGIQNAYCYAYGGKFYAGEFYRKGNYETPSSHHLTQNGETNYAIVYEYELDGASEGGVKAGPQRAVSVRGLVQGFAVYEDVIVLSTSYGLPDSTLYTYENVLAGEASGTIEVNGAQIPLYRLDKTNLKSTFTTPCMSEEIFIADGRVYILYESACKKYKMFVRFQVKDILSMPVASL